MNKKFSTLVAGLLLAGAFTVNAQKDTPLMPRSAKAFGEDVTALQEVGTGSNQYKSNGYYQLKVGKEGTNALAMVWDETTNKYKLTSVDISKENQPLDNTLWQISASWDKTSGAVNYVFVNKATLLPLQVAYPGLKNDGTIKDPIAATVEGTVTNWLWNPNAKVLDNTDGIALTAFINAEYKVTIVEKDGALKVEQYAAQSDPTGTPIVLIAKEAGRVVLTADQINTKLNYAEGDERTRLDIVFTPDVENPDPEYAKNIITSTAWVAKGYKFDLGTEANAGKLVKSSSSTFKVPDFAAWGNADKDVTFSGNTVADQFVQLVSYKDLKEGVDNPRVLMVDTAYYDTQMNNKYDLALALKPLEKARDKYVVNADGSLGNLATPTGITAPAYASFEKQTLFQFIYEPTYDRVLVVASQATYVAKENLKDNYKTANETYIPFAWAEAATTKGETFDGYWDKPTITLTAANDAEHPVIAYNQVKLVYLAKTSSYTHSELTVNVPDAIDMSLGQKGFGGALTNITLKGTRGLAGEWSFANIAEGYYYVQNAKKQPTALIPVGAWAYQDLTATPSTYYVDPVTGIFSYRNDGNVVYSTEQFKTMPSAQWYIKGEGGYYTIYNRESGKDWSTNYWYAVKDENGKDIPNVYTNYGTFSGNGINSVGKDTIRLVNVPTAALKATNGYLNITQAEAMADTSVFTFKYVSPLENIDLGMIMQSDSSLIMANGEAMKFKLERVTKDDVKYGYEEQHNLANKLQRTRYYIYLDEVNSNSAEETGYHERKYVVLEGGQYRLANMYVHDMEDGTTGLWSYNTRFDRAQFYVKEIGEANKNYVLVDAYANVNPSTAQGAETYNGARMAMDQLSLLMRANGLASVAENVYTNSLLNLVREANGNYRADLAYGDTVKIFSNEYPEVVMYENKNLLAMSSLEVGRDYATALFVDTAYVRANTARPQYMFALRPVVDPTCNIPGHNHHAIEGDYLVHLQDSALIDVNKYTWDNKKFARLGFVAARHDGDTLLIKNSTFTGNNDLLYPNTTNKDYEATTIASQDTIDLADNSKDQYCTFALRYVDTNRDAFYLETLFRKGTPGDKYNNEVADQKGWVRWHNGVPVVVNDLSQAGKFNFAATNEAPTANEGINASEVSIVAGNGVVVVKNAAGKNVAISNILGKSIANVVLSSDNETISVPAGIVVVSVEGEEAVKAVVK